VQNPVALVRRLPATVQVLILGTLVNKLGSFIFPFLSLVLSREFALSAPQVAWLLMAYGVGSLVSIVVGGELTDRLGRRRTMLLSLAGSGVLAVAMGCAPSLRAFVPLLIGFSFLSDLYRPASSALIGDLLPSSERAVGYAALRLAVNLGFFVGMGLGGVLVDWHWRVMYVADGLTTLACAWIVHRHIGETRPLPEVLTPGPAPAGDAPTPAAARGGPRSPWQDRTFLVSCAASFVFALGFFTDFTVLPLTMTRSAGYPAWVFGLIVGMNGLLIAIFEVSVTASLRRWRRLRVAALGALLTGVGFGLTGVFLHWSWFLVASLLWTAGEILTLPQHMAFAADWSPPAARGRYLSVHSATWSLAAAVSPPLLLPLHERLGEQRFWPLLFLVLLPAAGILLWLDRHADQPQKLRGRV
jgi:MFS family permease